MIRRARPRVPVTVLPAFSIEQWGAARYRRRQKAAGSGGSAALDRAHPLEFDESGFPVAQRTSSFGERVARLRKPL